MEDIKGYEGLYSVTREGEVYSHRSNKFLKGSLDRDGYRQVCLTAADGKSSKKYVHRLVAIAFIDNPNNLPQVNHIDEDKLNNCVDNLEWADYKRNSNHGTRNKRISMHNSTPVYCVELDRVFYGVNEAARELNISTSGISRCCTGEYKTTHGYHFCYATKEVS